MKAKARWKIPLMEFSDNRDDLIADANPKITGAADDDDDVFASVERANDGTALREYLDDTERFAEAEFRKQRIDLSIKRRSRCAQIVQEYECVVLDQAMMRFELTRKMVLADPASFKPWVRRFFARNARVDARQALENLLGYKPLHRDQIDARLYCAAKVLLSVDNARRWLRRATGKSQVTPARLIAECLPVEGSLQQLAYTIAYSHRHGGKAGRDARAAKKQERRQQLKSRDIRKRITEADYRSLRDEFGITQRTLKNDLDAIRKRSP